MSDSTLPQIMVRRGPNPDHIYIITEPTSIIGREPINDVVLPDPEVSRRHARLVLRQGRYHIEDLSSTNGTYINGRRIAALTPLTDGDVIDFGETIRVVFHLPAESGTGESVGTNRLKPVSNAYEDNDLFESSVPFPFPQQKPVDPVPDDVVQHILEENSAQSGEAETISELSGMAISPPAPPPPPEVESAADVEPGRWEKLVNDRRIWVAGGCLVLLVGLCSCGAFMVALNSVNPALFGG